MMNFPESALAASLDNAGLSRLELADKLGIDVSQIIAIGKRLTPCRPGLQERISATLKVPASSLFDVAGYCRIGTKATLLSKKTVADDIEADLV